ncbi:hypothetical protein GDO86_018214 [Hymenochirus boettgeri]|uniref:Uncharacterized protein n=1 Tax=Hymenochirus boettgeri TaxID=247094 RepID=A0A8T2ILM6_9PIPI|nr:hypothetical protein GDO86_018214 [Hymenochirus boettgeri]
MKPLALERTSGFRMRCQRIPKQDMLLYIYLDWMDRGSPSHSFIACPSACAFPALLVLLLSWRSQYKDRRSLHLPFKYGTSMVLSFADVPLATYLPKETSLLFFAFKVQDVL